MKCIICNKNIKHKRLAQYLGDDEYRHKRCKAVLVKDGIIYIRYKGECWEAGTHYK